MRLRGPHNHRPAQRYKISKNNRFRRKNQGVLKNSAKLEQASQSIDGPILVQPEKAGDRHAPGDDQAPSSRGGCAHRRSAGEDTSSIKFKGDRKNVDYDANRT